MDISSEDLDILLQKRQSLREALGPRAVHSEDYKILDAVLLNVGKLKGSIMISDGLLRVIIPQYQVRDLQLNLMKLRARHKSYHEMMFRETTLSRQRYARRKTALTQRQINELETLLKISGKEVTI